MGRHGGATSPWVRWPLSHGGEGKPRAAVARGRKTQHLLEHDVVPGFRAPSARRGTGRRGLAGTSRSSGGSAPSVRGSARRRGGKGAEARGAGRRGAESTAQGAKTPPRAHGENSLEMPPGHDRSHWARLADPRAGKRRLPRHRTIGDVSMREDPRQLDGDARAGGMFEGADEDASGRGPGPLGQGCARDTVVRRGGMESTGFGKGAPARVPPGTATPAGGVRGAGRAQGGAVDLVPGPLEGPRGGRKVPRGTPSRPSRGAATAKSGSTVPTQVAAGQRFASPCPGAARKLWAGG